MNHRYFALPMIFSAAIFSALCARNASATPDPITAIFVEDPAVPSSMQDRAKFNAQIVPKLTAYLASWEASGVPIHARTMRYFIGPAAKVSANAIRKAYFGDNSQSALNDLAKAIRNTQSAAELQQLLNANTCRFTMIVDEFRQKLLNATAAGKATDDEVDWIRRRSSAMLGEIATGDAAEIIDDLDFIDAGNADHGYTGALNCDYIRLSHETAAFGQAPHQDKMVAPPFLDVDTVLHETGHSFHDILWSRSSPFPNITADTAVLEEAFADTFTTSFLDDPCYILGKNKTCARHMDVFDQPLFEMLLNVTDVHDANPAVRNFLWLAHKAAPTTFPKAFVAAVQALDPLQRARPNSLNSNDPFLELKNSVERTFGLANSLLAKVCEGIGGVGPCSDQERFLGQLDSVLLDTWKANSPTVIGAGGRAIQFAGQAATIKFAFVDQDDEQRIEATVEQNGVAQKFLSDGSRDGRDPTIDFTSETTPVQRHTWSGSGIFQ